MFTKSITVLTIISKLVPPIVNLTAYLVSNISGINYYEILNAKEKILNILNNIDTTGVLNKVKKHKDKVYAIER